MKNVRLGLAVFATLALAQLIAGIVFGWYGRPLSYMLDSGTVLTAFFAIAGFVSAFIPSPASWPAWPKLVAKVWLYLYIGMILVEQGLIAAVVGALVLHVAVYAVGNLIVKRMISSGVADPQTDAG